VQVGQQLVDSELLGRLERLAIHWQKSLPGLVGGHHMSRFGGPGQEFLDHRQFHHGDDLRAVNWRAFLRLEKLFLKMFQLEPRVPVRLLLDTSRSMITGGPESGGTLCKFDYARKLTAALCYVGLVRLDAICIQPFSEKLSDSFVSSGGRHRFMPAVRFLNSLRASGRTNFFQVAREFTEVYPQRGVIIVVSDFLDDADCEQPLKYLAEFGHELLLVHVWAPEDRSPPWNGELELLDAETGNRLEIDFNPEARRQYETAFDEYSGSLQRIAARHGGRTVSLPTTASIEEAIFGPLMRAGIVE
jgi:uncharacterized protein (DUF58 family)